MSMSHWSLHPASIAHPNAELELLIEDDTIHAEGVLDETTIDLLLGAAGSLFDRGAHDVTVDLAGTSVIDSTAIRELLIAQTGAVQGTALHLVAPPRLRPRLAACRVEGSAPRRNNAHKPIGKQPA